jgi:hypothetical protein
MQRDGNKEVAAIICFRSGGEGQTFCGLQRVTSRQQVETWAHTSARVRRGASLHLAATHACGASEVTHCEEVRPEQSGAAEQRTGDLAPERLRGRCGKRRPPQPPRFPHLPQRPPLLLQSKRPTDSAEEANVLHVNLLSRRAERRYSSWVNERLDLSLARAQSEDRRTWRLVKPADCRSACWL